METKMQYSAGERDMLLMKHTFIAEYPEGKKEKITCTLIDYGLPNGDSSMARTVSLPVAISIRLVLEGKFTTPGLQIPIIKELYEPILQELEALEPSIKVRTSLISHLSHSLLVVDASSVATHAVCRCSSFTTGKPCKVLSRAQLHGVCSKQGDDALTVCTLGGICLQRSSSSSSSSPSSPWGLSWSSSPLPPPVGGRVGGANLASGA
jgi:hypothetical protein